MKKSIIFPGLLTILFAMLFQSCLVEDPIKIPELEVYVEENFTDLDLETVQSIETPFQALFQSTGSRTNGGISLEDISARLAEIFPDVEVLEVEEEMERGLSVWEIKLKMAGGGIVKIDFVQELGLIVKIKGKSGPFDYEIDPGGSFIAFSEAVQVAMDAVGGEVQKWELSLEENNEWEYEIHVINDTQRYEIEIRGFETEIISIKQKEENQDRDENTEQEAAAPDNVAELALSLFPGTIIHSETKSDEGHPIWKVYVESETGAIVKFKILEDPLELIEMESEKGPFGYNIEPGDPYTSLNSALELAQAVFPGELEKWGFGIIHRDDNVLGVYEFKLSDGDVRVELLINAETGELLDFDGGEHSGHNADVPAEVAEFAQNLFAGEIIEGHLIHENGANLWKLHIRSEAGAVVRFLISAESLELVEMKGEEGPFEYNIDPGDAFISLQEAIEIAHSVADGDVLEWKFGFETEEGILFPFYLVKALKGEEDIRIIINAESGEVVHFDGQDEPGDVPAGVAELALSLLPGEIIESELHHSDGQNAWELYIGLESGAVVKFTISEDPVELLEMRGKTGPFEYEIDPGLDLISLQEAIEIAVIETGAELVEWKFGFEGESGSVFPFYLMHLVSPDFEGGVLVHAETGEILHIDDHQGDQDNLPETVAELALTIFPGDILEFHRDNEGDVKVWKVFVANSTGSIVGMVIKEDPLTLLALYSEAGPFEYNIDPGDPFVTLNQARETAGMQVSGELIFWSFETHHGNLTDMLSWTYELVYATPDGEVTVILNAESGEIIEIRGVQDHGDDPHERAPEEVNVLAQSIFTGDIVHSEKHMEGDLVAWELLLESTSGAKVKFYILQDPLEILKIRGSEGPFDYNIEPGTPYLSLNAVTEIAQAEFTGDLADWEFRTDHSNDVEIKIYELRLMGADGKVVEFEINAETGDILSIND